MNNLQNNIEYIEIFDQNYTRLGVADKKLAHKLGLWHESVVLIMIDYDKETIFFQLKHSGLYDFERPDYIDFIVGGHVKQYEKIFDAIKREIKEEINIEINEHDISYLGMRQSSHVISENFIENEFQHFFLNKSQTIKVETFETDSEELREVIEIKILDLIKLLEQELDSIDAVTFNPVSGAKNKMIIGRNNFVPSYISKDKIFLKIAYLAANAIENYKTCQNTLKLYI